jgi:hypothetical protein
VAFDPFRVDLDGVLDLSRRHADAVASLKKSMGTAATAGAAVDRVHGSIGSRVTGAFGAVLDARQEALNAASHTSDELAQRLGHAVLAYTRGDESGAETVRAAAEAMTGGSSGTPLPTGSSGAIGAAESSGVGDALGQVGPRGDQLAESAGQPLRARATDEDAERLTRE